MTKPADQARRERRLEAARRAYQERFGEDVPAPPYIHPRFADALMEAVERGRPLNAEPWRSGWATHALGA
jgi:hypothetical protein